MYLFMLLISYTFVLLPSMKTLILLEFLDPLEDTFSSVAQKSESFFFCVVNALMMGVHNTVPLHIIDRSGCIQ